MRNRAMGLSALFVLSLAVAACGGTIRGHQEGRPRHRRRDARGQVVQRGVLGRAPRPAPQALGGTASNIVTKAPADYAANIKTFVDQGYGTIVTVGFAMGDATTAAAKQYPNVKFIGVDQGVCVDETGKSRPDLRLQGRPEEAPAELPGPGLQGGAGRLPRRRPRRTASRSRASSAPSAASTRSRRSSATSTAIATAPRRSGSSPRTSRSPTSRRDITKAFNDPGTGKSIAQQMIGQKADVIFQVAGLSGRRRDRGRLRHAGRHRHRRRRRPVEVAPAVGQVHPDQRREEACQRRRRPRSRRSGPRPTSAAPPSGTPRPTPVGVGLSPYGSDYKDLVTPEIQAKIDAALAGMKDGSRRSLQADRLRQEGLTLDGRVTDSRTDGPTSRRPVRAIRIQSIATRGRPDGRGRRPALEMRGITKRYPGVLPTTASTSTCARARSTPCSARTAPASRP